ncbi:helix-hairpin-helix domain-containing protein [uncultured Thiohalocapsa sp.]|uniref:helix-hairpin-helix domain-containing protein n=1 Tax=uncultured Thiohalocapsa sp. TaxID=768990 RepID=UPI0025E7E6F3|nr:helix-hairpin-helix domain-containing protein [uncultured Thiohalocapsa sp.]
MSVRFGNRVPVAGLSSHAFSTGLLLLVLLLPFGVLPASTLQTFDNARLIPTEWADGDSFLVAFPNGDEHTVRLYGADCIEYHVTDATDARRLRAQRRYFGIKGYGGELVKSVELAKSLGKSATDLVREVLARPFSVHTSFADGGGDGRYKRIYAFITTADGQDLGTLLVSRGLARAFGVYRGHPDGRNRDEYRESLKDTELIAASERRGAWAYTDWNALAAERSEERQEEAEIDATLGRAPPPDKIDINTAARDVLMQIPQIGEVRANRIIEGRPYRRVDELLKVKGIGEKRLEMIREWVVVSP